MRFLLLLAVIVLIEAAAFATVADAVGGLRAVAGVALTTLGGFLLLARQGRTALRRLEDALNGQRRPGAIGRELWLALTAALLAFPGYASDALGLLLLLPPVRMALRDLVFFRLVAAVRRPGRHPRAIIEGDWRDETKPPASAEAKPPRLRAGRPRDLPRR